MVQALILVPALWLLTPRRADPEEEKLEWGAYVVVLLLFSASATYHFCVLILPAVLAAGALFQRGWVRRGWLIVLLYAVVCFPLVRFLPESPSGWRILLGFPRLYALTAFWVAFGWVLRETRLDAAPHDCRTDAMVLGLLFGAMTVGGCVSNLRHARGQVAGYGARVDRRNATLLAGAPALAGDDIYFDRMGAGGSVLDRTGADLRTLAAPGTELFHPTVTEASTEGWVERSSSSSQVVRFARDVTTLSAAELPVEVEGEQPVISRDARWLAFLRTDRGRGELYLLDRGGAESPLGAVARERHLDGAPHDVLDYAFYPDDRIVLAAVRQNRARLYAGDAASERFVELTTGEEPARYPAVSPDGAWLAYDRNEHGAWQLWVMNLRTGAQTRLTDADCNSTEPAWASDSKDLVYATDCGRGLGYTALSRMQAVP